MLKPLKNITCFEEGSTQKTFQAMAFARNLDYRCPLRRIEYLALEKIYVSDSRIFATKIIMVCMKYTLDFER